MFEIIVYNDWNETVHEWFVNLPEDDVKAFVSKMNNGVGEELRKKAESNNLYYFTYRKVEAIDTLPLEEEIIELMRPYDYWFNLENESDDENVSEGVLTVEDIKNWDPTKVTDFTDMFKDCK